MRWMHTTIPRVWSLAPLRAVALCCVLPAAADTPVPTVEAPLPSSTLIYVSDYFAFVGRDAQGHVAFALNNNRGRDGDDFQAEHFVVLHDERTGWVTVTGNGAYDNVKKELARIPDSAHFEFHGSPATGLTIVSPSNHLTLKIDPIPQRHRRTHGQSVIWMGSAPAVLTWQGRMVSGRVIYEFLVIPEFNRLTRTYWGMWNEFQGWYLVLDRIHDLYLHSQRSERMAPLVGKRVGFAVLHDQAEAVPDFDMTVLSKEMAVGFFRWPTQWRITWQGRKGPADLDLALEHRNEIFSWVLGGFSMGIVRGELRYDGRAWPIYGLVELIM